MVVMVVEMRDIWRAADWPAVDQEHRFIETDQGPRAVALPENCRRLARFGPKEAGLQERSRLAP